MTEQSVFSQCVPISSFPTVAVAFGGGGSRGLAHIHVIEALDELGVRPVAISGTSIGAIMGTAMAAGLSGEEIRMHAQSALGGRARLLMSFFRSNPKALNREGGNRFGSGAVSIEQILSIFLPARIPEVFEQLEIPLSIAATDFYTGKEVVFNSGEIFSAVAASACIPGVFQPVVRNGRITVDGGLSNPVPFDHLHDVADIVIAVDVAGLPYGDDRQFPSATNAIYGASQIMQQSILSLKMERRSPDILLRPEVGRFKALEFLRFNGILEASAAIKDETKRQVDVAYRRHQLKIAG